MFRLPAGNRILSGMKKTARAACGEAMSKKGQRGFVWVIYIFCPNFV
jgi:hypothetical protein